jgi:hypothetical protein
MGAYCGCGGGGVSTGAGGSVADVSGVVNSVVVTGNAPADDAPAPSPPVAEVAVGVVLAGVSPGPSTRFMLEPAAGEVPETEVGAVPASRPTVVSFVRHAPRIAAAPTQIPNSNFCMVNDSVESLRLTQD